MHVTRLRCEHLIDPMPLDTPRPRLSWVTESTRRDAAQTAYQIQVATTLDGLAEPNLWDSGRVEGPDSVLVPYAGERPASRQRCFWRVRVWDGEDVVSPYSDPAWWEAGLRQDEWCAEWISAEGLAPGRPAYLRRRFSNAGDVARSRLYISALGVYRAFVNDIEVTDAVLSPGWTDYAVRTQYQAYDIGSLLRDGDNVIGAVVGDGWYAGRIAWLGREVYGAVPKLIAQLEIRRPDGSGDVLPTDASWCGAAGPIVSSDMLDGEVYDARLADPTWCTPASVGDRWAPVVTHPDVATVLVAPPGEPVRRTELRRPVHVARRPEGVVFDLGQNFAGWVGLELEAPSGTEVTIRHGEMLNTDGSLYVENLRGAPSTDRYIASGDGVEGFEPSFTYHGFRYVEVSGDVTLADDAVTGVVVHSDLAVSGGFECSNDMLNQLQRNIVWGQRGNFVDVPTDCPQRDERLGWLGDAQVFARTACWNMSSAGFFTKWLQDVLDAQTPEGWFYDTAPAVRRRPDNDYWKGTPWPEGAPAWGDAGVIIPWTLYQLYGDRDLLAQCFPAMLAWVRHIERHNQDLIWVEQVGHNYSDWLSVGEETPAEVLATAYFARSADLTARAAEVLGLPEEAERLRTLGSAIRTAFRAAFVDATTGRVKGETQTGYVLALHFDLLTPDERAAAIDHLVERIEYANWHIATGFVGVSHLLPTLADAGRADVAYRLLLNESYPSWGYSVRHGATTMWERWDGWTADKGFQNPEMNSFNHYAFGSVGEFLYRYVAGIDVGAPGYRHVVIRPVVGGGLTWARGWLDSPYGRIESAWSLSADALRLDVTIPVGATADIHFPTQSAAQVTEGGALTAAVDAPSGPVLRVGAGTYSFDVREPALVELPAESASAG